MKKMLIALLAASLLTACNSNEPKENKEGKETGTATAGIKKYGEFDGKEINEYKLVNKNGLEAGILNYGGTVTYLMAPDKNGVKGDVLLGYDSLAGYIQKGNPYFGCLVGRYANRIANGKFTLDGQTYTLAANNNGQSLHGGLKGYDKVVWDAEKMPGDSSLKLTYLSKDGEEGYPGNVTATVVYTLTSDNALKIEYSATTDKATPVNLTNHCYFNLSAGADSTILGHELMINADKFTEVNDVLIPTGKNPDVTGTPMDFRKQKAIGKDIAAVKGGYDHNWVLNKKGNEPESVCVLYHPASGRKMEVLTTEPGLQFYSGNFLDGTLQHTRKGTKYVLHAGLCLETQHFPDSPNQPSFPTTILKPGETYHHTTLYKFSAN